MPRVLVLQRPISVELIHHHPDNLASAVGEMDYTERVEKAAAPLTSVKSLVVDPTDIVSVATKAAQSAAVAASEHA